MKFTVAASAALGFASLSHAINVAWDAGYDDKTRSLNVVSCSDGANGLETRYGWKTQGDVPAQYVGGYEGIAGWNSPQCGTCFTLSYGGNTITVLAIDHAAVGFNVGQNALNALTNGQAVQFGHVDATVTQVDVSQCGIK